MAEEEKTDRKSRSRDRRVGEAMAVIASYHRFVPAMAREGGVICGAGGVEQIQLEGEGKALLLPAQHCLPHMPVAIIARKMGSTLSRGQTGTQAPR